MIIKIPVHSITSLITNSSTTIYTREENSEKALKELIDEFIKSFNLPYKFDDIFDVIHLEEDNTYFYFAYDNDVGISYTNYSDCNKKVQKIYNDVASFKMPKPDWFAKAEKNHSRNSYIYISAKDPKFEKLANLVKKFLESTESFEGES
jgi:hypothetical protein